MTHINQTELILLKLNKRNPVPEFNQREYPKSYAMHLMSTKGETFLPDTSPRDDLNEWSESQLEKAVTRWAYTSKLNEAELWCDIADAYLIKAGIPLMFGRREIVLTESQWEYDDYSE